MPGPAELTLILLIVVVLFGASRLPKLGDALGRGIRNLKRGLNTDDDIEIETSDRRIASDSSAQPVSAESGELGEVSEAEVEPLRRG